MGITELLALIGDDKIRFQNLNNCLDNNFLEDGQYARNSGETRLSFVTDQSLHDVTVTGEVTGLVLWIKTKDLNKALRKGGQKG